MPIVLKLISAIRTHQKLVHGILIYVNYFIVMGLGNLNPYINGLRVRFSAGARDFPFFTASRSAHNLLFNEYRRLFSWRERGRGREDNNSPPSGAEIKNIRTIIPLCHTSSCRGV
jgi:hypothetical protein